VPKLTLYNDYARLEVHDIFAPWSNFTPQAGTWGLQKIVQIPERQNDFVFFVTFGQKRANNMFDEGITTDGVLTWQSQPNQRLADRQIRQFIMHNEDANSIYLFLRTLEGRKFTYLGNLKYLAHDSEREMPVYFQWQILDWNAPAASIHEMGLTLESCGITPIGGSVDGPRLIQTDPPHGMTADQGNPLGTGTFRAQKVADYGQTAARDIRIGRAGELLVLEYEKQQLINTGLLNLAGKVRHVSELEGDGAGYDIESFMSDGTKKFIEVKTTTGDKHTEFFITANELEFAKRNSRNFYLFRVYEYDDHTDRGKFFGLHGLPQAYCALFPVQYRVKVTRQNVV